jgi:hypothetical protein
MQSRILYNFVSVNLIDTISGHCHLFTVKYMSNFVGKKIASVLKLVATDITGTT